MDPGERESHDRAQTRPSIFEDSETEWEKRAGDLFQSLRSPAVPSLPECDLSRYKNPPKCTPAEAWRNCAEAIERYDADSCKAYREEIDTLLVFAGLFSAVLTAFTIESYQWLQDDPNDAIIALLSQLVQAQGSTHSAPSPSGLPDVVSVRINAYWFLSLILSLSSALIAILCKQWVREFERHAGQSHEQYISIRQMKLEGFEGWGVATVVTVIPLLLQSALALFALGLMQLLWNLHLTVAIVALIPSITAFLFYGATTLLPALQLIFRPLAMRRTVPQCPYKSPQSMLVLRALLVLVKHTHSWYSASIRLVAMARSPLHIRIPAPLRRRVRIIFQLLKSSVASSGLARRFWRQRSRLPICMTFDYAPWDMRDRLQWWTKYWGLLIRDGEGSTAKASQPLSWITLDADLLHMRDLLYSDAEYFDDVRSGYNSVPPRAYFRGLLWLRTYVDQPGLPHWLWLTAWETIVKPGSHRSHSISPLHAYLGIRHLMSSTAKDRLLDSCTIFHFLEYDLAVSAAIVYAADLNFDAAFIAELVIRHLLGLRNSLKACQPSNIVEMLGRGLDAETSHSLLHAVLSDAPVRRSSHLSCLLVKTSIAVSSVISQPEIACVIATYLRWVYPKPSVRVRTEKYLDNLLQLFYVMADCLERDWNGGSYDPGAVQSVELMETFGLLALALDDYFTDIRGEPELAGQAAFGLCRQPYRSTYVGLLSINLPVPRAHAVINMYLEPLARWYSSLDRSQEAAQRKEEQIARCKEAKRRIILAREQRTREERATGHGDNATGSRSEAFVRMLRRTFGGEQSLVATEPSSSSAAEIPQIPGDLESGTPTSAVDRDLATLPTEAVMEPVIPYSEVIEREPGPTTTGWAALSIGDIAEIFAQYPGLWPEYPCTIGRSVSEVEPGPTRPMAHDYCGLLLATPTGRGRRSTNAVLPTHDGDLGTPLSSVPGDDATLSAWAIPNADSIVAIRAEYPALRSSCSGVDFQSASEIQPGPAASTARDYDGLSLLASPDRPGAEQDEPHDAEAWVACSSMFGDDATIPDTTTWAAARWTGYSRAVNQPSSDEKSGTSGWAAHDYDELSLLATPERHGVEVDPLHDAEPETTFSPASGGYDTGSQSSPEHENLVTAALASYDAERSTTISTMDDGETTNSQSNEVDEAFLAAALSLSTTEEELPVSQTDGNASTRLPENPSNAVPVAGRDGSLATAVAVPASRTDVSGAWTNQEPYDPGAAAVVPPNIAPGVHPSAEHGDEELSSLVTGPAGGGLDPCAASFAVSDTERGTELIIKTGGELSTGTQASGSKLDSEPRHQ